ncbi:MAG: beta-galactosidase [Terracidiphilus sp.]
MKIWLVASILTVLLSLTSGLPAQQVSPPFFIDATTPAPAPETGFLNMGGVSPSGRRISVDSRNLSLDGKPWLPVMGEFHFSRYPEKYWREELLKMKAGGVQVVTTYIFWIHHEEIEGQFDWTGQRDLRHFVELCGQSGLSVFLRIGPWDHGEVRNGGFPDWLINKKIPLRRNDPEYLKYVGRFYGQIGSQVKGFLWQDGGPILGVQLENEYSEVGPGAGAEHLAELKRLAIAAGIDPPLFSVTGWPGHDYPVHEVIPVSGAYPDDFWTSLTTDSAPNPVYLFSTDRALGDMGAMALGDPEGKIDLRHYPFIAAEQGGGMETSYHRRPLLMPDDIAALTLTALGSGVNSYGYYMFHGGANPAGKLTTLEESIATGYPNDLPVVSYDFQAPLGEYGQERESFRKVKSLHLFLKCFGSDLAVMTPYAPDKSPQNAADASLARVMLRADGNRGFLFVNNYVRKLEMPQRLGFQARIKLLSGTVDLPHTPIDVPANSHFIWPLNLDLGVGRLDYSTAQLLSRLENDDETTYFFFAIPGLRTEFAFDPGSVASVVAASGSVILSDNIILVKNVVPGKESVLQVAGKNGRKVRILLLTEAQAEQFWRVSFGGQLANQDTVLLSPADVFAGDDGVHLRSIDPSRITASFFLPEGQRDNPHALWREQTVEIQPRKIDFEWRCSREAVARLPTRMASHVEGRDRPMPLAPENADFAGAAAWSFKVPAQSMAGLSDIYLRIHYAGDIARLSLDGRLLDDDFYNGRPWEIGLKRFLPESFGKSLEVSVFPLPRKAPIYLDAHAWEPMNADGQTAKVSGVELLPEYEVVLNPDKP